MGVCCETTRKTIDESPLTTSTPATASTERSDILAPFRRKKPKKYIPTITEDSFQRLTDSSISSIYRRDGQDIKCIKFSSFLADGSYFKLIDPYWHVYPVVHGPSGALGLMKVIKKIEIEKRMGWESFYENLAIQKELDHPHIAKIHELYQDEKKCYIIYEGIRGDNLFERMKARRYLKEDEIDIVARQLISVLSYLHKRKIVNRFVLPENFFFEISGCDYTLKIVDFMFAAKTISDGKPVSVYYSAPEVINEQFYNVKSEMWSFGVLLYSMFAGDMRIVMGPCTNFEPIQTGLLFEGQAWEGVSDEMREFIAQLLKIDPNERITPFDVVKEGMLGTQIFPEKTVKNLILDKFIGFELKSKISVLVSMFMIERIVNPKEKLQYVKAFEFFDQDEDGVLKKSELTSRYFKFRGNALFAQKEIEKIFKTVDFDNAQEISFTKFLSFMMDKSVVMAKQNLLKTFKLLDKQQKGYLTKEDLALHLGGSRISEEEWESMFAKIDIQRNNKVTFDDFSQLMGFKQVAHSLPELK